MSKCICKGFYQPPACPVHGQANELKRVMLERQRKVTKVEQLTDAEIIAELRADVIDLQKRLDARGKEFLIEEETFYPSVMGPQQTYRVINEKGEQLLPEKPSTGWCHGLSLDDLVRPNGILRKNRKYRITVEVIEEGPPLGENHWRKKRG